MTAPESRKAAGVVLRFAGRLLLDVRAGAAPRGPFRVAGPAAPRRDAGGYPRGRSGRMTTSETR
jgi:hypothetical protein